MTAANKYTPKTRNMVSRIKNPIHSGKFDSNEERKRSESVALLDSDWFIPETAIQLIC